jgi:hypothetical protein
MSTSTAKHAQGTFCWPELGTTDLAAARTFYTGLFGWNVREIPMGEGETYLIFRNGDKECAAGYRLMKSQTDMGIPPYWGAYVAVDDCDAAADRVRKAGGQVVVEPMDIMGTLGRMAACTDPQGAFFSIYQAKDHPGVATAGEPGSLCWTELMTTDTDKAAAFYGSVIGWTTEAMTGPMQYTMWKSADGQHAGGMMKIAPEMGEVPPHWMNYFHVTDIAGTFAKATGMGARVTVPVTDIPNMGQFAILQDPQGAHFALFTPKPA